MNNQSQRDNSSLWFLLGGFLSVTLIAFFNRLPSRPSALPTSSPQPIHVDVQLPQQTTTPEPERVNWDVIGFASVAVTLVSAAIFYIAGWFYEGYWHAFFGIDIAQINASPYRVMLQGSAGVFVLILSFIVAIITSPKQVQGQESRENTTFYVQTIARTLTISFLLVAGLGFIFFLWPKLQGASLSLGDFSSTILSAVIGILLNLFSDRLYNWINSVRQKQDNTISEANEHRNSDTLTYKMVIDRFTRTWRIWSSFVFVSLLILSLIFSAILGRFEARRGAKFLSGNWHLEEAYIISDVPLASFPESMYLECLPDFTYGPVSQASLNEQTYFFVDWKDEIFFQSQPNLYVIANNEKNNIQLVYPNQGVELSCK